MFYLCMRTVQLLLGFLFEHLRCFRFLSQRYAQDKGMRKVLMTLMSAWGAAALLGQPVFAQPQNDQARTLAESVEQAIMTNPNIGAMYKDRSEERRVGKECRVGRWRDRRDDKRE